MTLDPVFPLPEPTFLWVHNVSVERRVNTTKDSEGRWKTSTVPTLVTGYMSNPEPEVIQRAASEGIRVDAVLLVPNGTAVSKGDRVKASTSGIPSYLLGFYDVSNVRPNQSHVRVLLTRIGGTNAAYPR